VIDDDDKQKLKEEFEKNLSQQYEPSTISQRKKRLNTAVSSHISMTDSYDTYTETMTR
jgi:hypothetical protein